MDEALALLQTLRLGADADTLTRNLPYGKQRLVEIALALATAPRILLLDEPAAGIPASESAELFAVIAALPRDVTIVFIEHDMELVFRFAERITVLVGGKVLTEGTPGRDRRRSARARGLSRRGAAWLSCSHSTGSPRATATVSCWTTCRSRSQEGDCAGASRPQRDGQDHAAGHADGAHAAARRLPALARRRLGRAARRTGAARAGLGWVPQERYMFPSLTVEEHLTVVARPGPWTVAARSTRCSRASRSAERNFGNQLSGGEQQMLAIARALMVNPSLLLLDEPMEGLAPIIVQELLSVDPRSRGRRRYGGHRRRAAREARAVADTGRRSSSSAESVVHRSASDALRDDPERLHRLLGVS